MKLFIFCNIFVLLFISTQAFAAGTPLTIIHTNDMHSRLQGFSPEIDYKPDKVNTDKTVGGWSRVATVIEKTRNERSNPVLVLDAGDFTMGSLFHMLNREEAFELRLLKAMGYDAVTFGNHEFDLKPAGLAATLRRAKSQNEIPQIVFAGALFDRSHPVLANLDDAFKEAGVKDYIILEKEGIKIGIFGIIGKDAVEVSPFAKPLKFRDPIQTAQDMVHLLRQKEKANVVICLSHGGIRDNPKKSEDEILASTVKGIDVIISGHSHTKLDQPKMIEGTILVQAWSYGRQAGILDIVYEKGKVTLKKWTPVAITSAVAGSQNIQSMINTFKKKLDTRLLSGMNLSYDRVIAETRWSLIKKTEECPLGNLIADATRWSINAVDSDPGDAESRVVVALDSNGIIRDDLMAGETGKITVGDLFRTIPMGIGPDESMGYPLVSFYVYGYEIKRALEILASVRVIKQDVRYFLQVSGVRFTYNPHRVLFDRVASIEIGSEEEGYVPLDYSASNKKLYRVGANIYNATFLKLIGKFTYSLLEIIPKNRKGIPIQNLSDALVDADKSRPGIQEMKQWQGLIRYVQSFPDINGNGIPDVPDKYKDKLGRIVETPSWNPARLVLRAKAPTLMVLGAVGVIALIIVCIVFIVLKKGLRSRNQAPR